MEKYGVVVLKGCAEAGAEVLNVVSKVLNKQGLWHLLGLQGAVKVFTSLDFAALKEELKDLSEVEREEVEAAFQMKLALVKKEVQAKLVDAVNLVEDGVDFVEDVVESGAGYFTRGKDLFQKAKALVGA